MKSCPFFLVFMLAFSLVGCGRSYRDADLVGSWRIATGHITQTYTFSPDNTFIIATASSKDLRLFGDWRVDAGQLVMTIRSNSFTTPVTNRETVHIAKLTDSLLILEDRDKNDDPRERTFQRLK